MDLYRSNFSTSGAEKLEIVNVDFHADYYNDNVKNDTQDCGNWCYFIKQEIPNTSDNLDAPKDSTRSYTKGKITLVLIKSQQTYLF